MANRENVSDATFRCAKLIFQVEKYWVLWYNLYSNLKGGTTNNEKNNKKNIKMNQCK